jgi:hypothetical protein
MAQVHVNNLAARLLPSLHIMASKLSLRVVSMDTRWLHVVENDQKREKKTKLKDNEKKNKNSLHKQPT